MVEVQSVGATAELQTTNSAVGDVLQHEEIDALPTSQREITEIVYLQPATTPISGGAEGSVGGGSVAGGRVDQNVLTIDGINITGLPSVGVPDSVERVIWDAARHLGRHASLQRSITDRSGPPGDGSPPV